MPKLVQKQGYQQIQPTGWENFNSFLQQFTQGIMQQMQQRRDLQMQNQARADQITREQANLRVTLAGLAQSDPEGYNKLVQDPAVIGMLDPSRAQEASQFGETRFDKWLRQRNANANPTKGIQEGYASATPGKGSVGRLPGGPELEPPEAIAEAKTLRAGRVAEAQARVQTASLEGKIAGKRTELLGQPDLSSQIFGMTGQPVTAGQLEGAELAKSPELLRAQIPGTLEWQRQKVREVTSDLFSKYQVVNQTQRDQVQALAEWQVGLRDKQPANLPPSMAQLQQALEQKGYNLRAEQLAFDKDQYVTQTRIHSITAASQLMERGVPIEQAMRSAEDYIKKGVLPAGLPPDKKGEAESALAQLRLEQLQLDVNKARAEDPELNQMFKLLEQYPSDQRASQPMFGTLVKRLGEKFGWATDVQGRWWIAEHFFGAKPIVTIQPGVKAQGATPPPDEERLNMGTDVGQIKAPGTAAIITPELVMRGKQLQGNLQTAFSTIGADQKQVFLPLIMDVDRAQKSGDAAAYAKAIDAIETQLRKFGLLK